MKPRCMLLLPLLLVAGCSMDTDPEDRRFYNRGWLWPHRDIDLDPSFDGPPKQPGMPQRVHPEKYKGDPIVDG
jgi:hypothetical protein